MKPRGTVAPGWFPLSGARQRPSCLGARSYAHLCTQGGTCIEDLGSPGAVGGGREPVKMVKGTYVAAP